MNWFRSKWKELITQRFCKHNYVKVYFPSMFGISSSPYTCQKCGHKKNASN